MPPDFVRTAGTNFVLNGAPFRVVGVNCYFLAWCGATARDSTIQAIRATGANTVRVMAYLNTAELPASGVTFQYSDGNAIVLNDGPTGLQRFDALIAAAEESGLRLILPLVNYWDDLGGMPTYLKWLFPNQNLPVEEFYRRPEAKAAYQNYVAQIFNRRNTITGTLYRDSPAILAWELANEPRCVVPGGRQLLLDWTAEMSQFVKRPENDPNHLLALGDEGFLRHNQPPNSLYTGEYGVDFEATLDFAEIDFGTYHFYPAPRQMNVRPSFAATWIRDHVAAAERANKPAILEEYGIRIGDYGVASPADRDNWYAAWQQSVAEAGGAGDLLWMFGCADPEVAGFRDDYTVYAATDVPSLIDHARAMSASSAIAT